MPDLVPITRPHFAYPFHMDGTKVAVNEQDTDIEIMEACEAIARTARGSRIDDPELGITLMEFGTMSGDEERNRFPLERLRSELLEGEPRATLLIEDSSTIVEDLVRKVSMSLNDHEEDEYV